MVLFQLLLSAPMTPQSILSSIWDASNRLRSVAKAVKVNGRQSTSLWERVEALTPGLKRIEVQQRALQQAHANSAEPMRHDPNLQRYLETMLSVVEDAVELVAKFSSASWYSRAWNRGYDAKAFASINEVLTQAQADLGLGLQMNELFSRQRDADDAKADLADISAKQDQIITLVEQSKKQAEAAAVSQQSFAQQQQLFLARFASMAEKQNARNKVVAAEDQEDAMKFVAHLARQMEQAELRMQRLEGAAAPSSSSASSSSASHVSTRDVLSEVLRIPLSDIEVGAKLGGGAFGDVFKSVQQYQCAHVDERFRCIPHILSHSHHRCCCCSYCVLSGPTSSLVMSMLQSRNCD